MSNPTKNSPAARTRELRAFEINPYAYDLAQVTSKSATSTGGATTAWTTTARPPGYVRAVSASLRQPCLSGLWDTNSLAAAWPIG